MADGVLEVSRSELAKAAIDELGLPLLLGGALAAGVGGALWFAIETATDVLVELTRPAVQPAVQCAAVATATCAARKLAARDICIRLNLDDEDRGRELVECFCRMMSQLIHCLGPSTRNTCRRKFPNAGF